MNLKLFPCSSPAPRLAAWLSIWAATGLLAGCNLQKDVDVPQPTYDAQLVVECYLVPGEPYRLVVQETTPFLATPQPAVVFDAVAVITGPRSTEVIPFSPDSAGRPAQLFTHIGKTPFDGRPGETYSLVVYDGAGRRLTATTVVQPVVPIDTVEVNFAPEADSVEAKALLLTRYRDPAPAGDAYRYYVVKESKRGGFEKQQSFEFTDDLFNGQTSAAGSSYRFFAGDTLHVKLFHIERAYWQFLESVDGAQGANGNPFAQPATIKSTVEGGLGVFTNLAWDERRLVLKRP